MELIRSEPNFRRLWAAQTISQIGTQISYLAIPLVAAITLAASPVQMGVLTAIGAVPALLGGLLAGALVDRHPRQPVLIGADLLRAFGLAIIPMVWLTGGLSLPWLYAVALLGGLGGLFFDLAYQAFVPAIVTRAKLLTGNSALELSRSAAEVIGPAIGGVTIQVLKAPGALALDALSFLASAWLIGGIRVPATAPRPAGPSTSLWAEARAGLRELRRQPPLIALAAGTLGLGLFNAMIEAMIILYLVRTIGMSPAMLGLVFAAGSVGFVLGAALPDRLVRHFGVGPTLAGAVALIGLSDLAIPLVGQHLIAVSIVVGLSQVAFGVGLTVFNVTRRSLLQAMVPDAMLGRVAGIFRTFGAGIAPLGALGGGLLGASLGLQAALAVAALGEAAVALMIWWSPLWRLSTFGEVPSD